MLAPQLAPDVDVATHQNTGTEAPGISRGEEVPFALYTHLLYNVCIEQMFCTRAIETLSIPASTMLCGVPNVAVRFWLRA